MSTEPRNAETPAVWVSCALDESGAPRKVTGSRTYRALSQDGMNRIVRQLRGQTILTMAQANRLLEHILVMEHWWELDRRDLASSQRYSQELNARIVHLEKRCSQLYTTGVAFRDTLIEQNVDPKWFDDISVGLGPNRD